MKLCCMELPGRGHEVVAVVRNPDKLAPRTASQYSRGTYRARMGLSEAIGGAFCAVRVTGGLTETADPPLRFALSGR
jgi:hypothetical protein